MRTESLTSMSTADARRRIIALSILTTVAFSCLIILSPLILALQSKEALQIVQIVFPVFAGYIGSAVLFLFRGNPSSGQAIDSSLLRYLVYAPFIVFWCIATSVVIYFYASNLPGHPGGMPFTDFATYVTLIISFMNATTGALVGFLFQSEEIARNARDPSDPSGLPGKSIQSPPSDAAPRG